MTSSARLEPSSRRSLWACYAFDIFASIHFSSAIIIPFFIEWGKLSYVQVYSLQSWFLIWLFLLEVPTGVMADRFGKKFSLGLGAAVGACGLFIFGVVPNVTLFFVAEFLAALSATLISGAFEAILYESSVVNGFSEKSKRIFGKSHALRMTGALIAAPIGAVVAAHVGINVPILMDATALLGALCAVVFITEQKAPGQTGTIVQSHLDITRQGFRFLRGHLPTRKIAVQMTIVGIAAYYIMWLYQPLLEQVRVPLEYYGWFSILFVGPQIIFAGNFGLIEKIVPSIERYIGISLFVLLTTFVLVIQFPSVYTVVLFILSGSHANAQIRYISAHINQWIPSAQRATVLSILNMIQDLLVVIVNPILGFSVDHSLKQGIALILILLLICLIAGRFLAVLRTQKIDRNIS